MNGMKRPTRSGLTTERNKLDAAASLRVLAYSVHPFVGSLQKSKAWSHLRLGVSGRNLSKLGRTDKIGT